MHGHHSSNQHKDSNTLDNKVFYLIFSILHMIIHNLLLLIMLIGLVFLAIYNYNAGRNLDLKAKSNISQFKECRKIANVSECNSVVKELNRELP